MAVVVHYVERTPDASDFTINGIRGVILAIENTVDNTPALIQARAVTVLNAQGHNIPPGYFNANRQTNTLNTAGRCIVNAGQKIIDI